MERDRPYRPARNQHLEPDHYMWSDRIYFITIRAYKSTRPFVRPDLNHLLICTLQEEQERLNCRVFTYCLMPDHLHYLISPILDGISVLDFTDQFKGKSTHRGWALGCQGKLWQPRCYDHVVRRDEDLRAIAQYILDNPVRKRLVNDAADWPWSGHLNPLPL